MVSVCGLLTLHSTAGDPSSGGRPAAGASQRSSAALIFLTALGSQESRATTAPSCAGYWRASYLRNPVQPWLGLVGPSASPQLPLSCLLLAHFILQKLALLAADGDGALLDRPHPQLGGDAGVAAQHPGSRPCSAHPPRTGGRIRMSRAFLIGCVCACEAKPRAPSTHHAAALMSIR